MIRRGARNEVAARRMAGLTLLAGLALGPGAPTQAEPLPAPGSLIDEACDIPIRDDAVAARLRCARLHVLRDPAQPEAGRFELAVVIRRSAEPKPGATPVLFLHGGPGNAITPWMGMGGRDPAPGHDLVGFDMRGGGRSSPRVCERSTAELLANFTHAEGPAAAQRERQRVHDDCLAEWRAAGFAPGQFGTARNIEDAEALRRALGVERWQLIGQSYGTTVAAHYVATHPERIEAAVLDSLYPPDEDVPSLVRMQTDLIEQLARDCRADAACAARWPDFRPAQLEAAVSALDAVPLAVPTARGPRQVDGLALRQLLMLLASFEAGARSAPLLLDAAQRRDADLLRGPLDQFSGGGEGFANIAAMLATDCADRPRLHAEDRGDDPMRLLSGLPKSLCQHWSPSATPPQWPYGGSVPLLILAPGYDSFQPDAKRLAHRLGPAAQVLALPAAAHGAWPIGDCVRGRVGDFLSDPSEPLKTGCLGEVHAPAFLLGVQPLSGPRALVAAASPPMPLVLASCSAALGLILVVIAFIRARSSGRSGLTRWHVGAAILGAASLAAIAICVSQHGPESSAALVYGLPAGWSWLPWLTLAPAALAAVAAWYAPRSPLGLLVCANALVFSAALHTGGWSPSG